MAFKLNPYIVLNGTVGKAVQHYEKALGAKVENLMRADQGPGSENLPPERKDMILHAALRVGEGTVMLSDSPPGQPAPAAGNVSIALHFTDPAEMEKTFAALGEGGTVVAPIADAFWGAKFGMLTDPFGVSWMFDCPVAQS